MNTIYKLIQVVLSIFIVLGSYSYAFTQTGERMAPELTEWYEPVPLKIVPGENIFLEPSSDAIILFDGTDMSKWQSSNGGEVPWKIQHGYVTIEAGTGDIQTRESFKSFQLYLEFRMPSNMTHKGQDRGNSGVYLQNRYEIQVLDAWENPTYVNGMGGSIYKQTAPLVNPAKRPGEWQSYNISFTAPEFHEDGSVISPARVTVIWNGVVVQNNTEILGHTPYVGYPQYTLHSDGPIRLQDHNSEVSYRNIWIRELNSDQQFSIRNYMNE
ncbi:MAG: DUF1080 domain-containing protein [Bacteroidales bacterium]